MEPTQKKNLLCLMMVLVAAALVIMYIFSLRSQLQEVRANQGNYEEQIQSLFSIQNTDALKMNREFLESFSTYQTTAVRYKKVEPFMTDQGFKATHPSGTELPDSEESVKSSMMGLRPFEYQTSKTEAEFLNESKLTTEFDHVAATDMVIVKTSLIFVKEQGWKVDECEKIYTQKYILLIYMYKRIIAWES